MFSSWVDDPASGDRNSSGDVFAVDLPIRTATDLDEDGIDDRWEYTWFGNLARDATLDYDGDGATDGEEFAAGTVPIDELSIFRAVATFGMDRAIEIHWRTVPGREYQVQGCETPDGAWVDEGPAVSGTGELVRVLASTTGGQRFYRVVVRT